MRTPSLVVLLLAGLVLVTGCGVGAQERTPVPTLIFVPKATSTPLPTFTTAPTPVDSAASAPADAMSTPTQRPFPRYTAAAAEGLYLVKRGDTLGKIAQEYNVSVDEIARANNIANRNALAVGQLLKIPGMGAQVKQTMSASAPDTPATTPLATEASITTRRIVLTGDLGALQKDGQTLWTAIGAECLDAGGCRLAQIGLERLDGEYALPAGTTQVRLWIGDALEGAKWWKRWDCQPASAEQPVIMLRIAKH